MPDIQQQLLNPVEQILLLVMILVIMLGMGATLRVRDFKEVLKRPKGVAIGFICQFGILPPIAYGMAVVLGLNPAMAIGLILVACLPGGTTSNMFTYFSRGSVALSISMTAASTVLAIVITPVLLELYASGFAGQIDRELQEAGEGNFAIPYTNIVISLVAVVVPVLLGMVLLKYSPDWAKTAEDTASFTGIIVILFLLSSVFIRHGNLFLETSWQVYLGAILIGLFGYLFGYGLAAVVRMAPRYTYAISLETGIRNGPLAFAIILLSFNEPLQSQMLWLPILYSTFIVITASFLTLFYRRVGRLDWEIYRNDLVHERLFGPNYPDLLKEEWESRIAAVKGAKRR